MFIPSLLSYSDAELEAKCRLIQNNQDIFRILTGQKKDCLVLHADVVLQDFAKGRGVRASVGLQKTLDLVSGVFKLEELILQVHIMGEQGEETEALEVVKDALKNIPKNIQLEIFIHYNYAILKNVLPIPIYFWVDFGEWDEEIEFNNKILLMTVKAGVGGQNFKSDAVKILKKIVSKSEVKNNSQDKIKCDGKYAKLQNIILDGGVKFNTFKKFVIPEFNSVIGSGFWGRFENEVRQSLN